VHRSIHESKVAVKESPRPNATRSREASCRAWCLGKSRSLDQAADYFAAIGHHAALSDLVGRGAADRLRPGRMECPHAVGGEIVR
jgi:hypothetical protein